VGAIAAGALAAALGGSVALRLGYDRLARGSAGEGGEVRQHRRDATSVTVSLPALAGQQQRAAGSHGAGASSRKNPNPLPSAGGAAMATGGVKTVEVDSARLTTMLVEQRERLRAARAQQLCGAAVVLREELQIALEPCRGRVGRFADWYFGYSTTYKLMGQATSSAARYAVTGVLRTEASLGAAVSADLQRYIERKYEALVLRPALTDPTLQRSFVRALHRVHGDYRGALQELDASVTAFVDAEAAEQHAQPPPPSAVVLRLDWEAQLSKVSHLPASYEKSPELTVALIAGGGMVGKAAGGAAAVAAGKALAAKLVAPFATKAAAAALGKGAVVGAAGGLLGGPIGALVGAIGGLVVGLGIDMGVSHGVALMQRPQFEADVSPKRLLDESPWL
jgi:hypothetical protein